MIVRLHLRAERDLEEAFDHYEHARRGLGHEFLTEFRRGVEKILLNPNAWQLLEEDCRRYRLKRFPYGVVYDVQGDEIFVLAVMHLSRKPGYWRG
jgi:plasmid stabilization system protein ParE